MISLIIPVYNTGKALNKCLNSVVNQTYRDLEIILVNDHSTDDVTNSLVQEWKAKDLRIKLIDKVVNEGVDMARYSAIQVVTGEYIMFIDSDDWIEKDALETLITISQKSGADVVIGKIKKIFHHWLFSKESPFERDWMERLIHHDELMSKYYLSYFGANILPIHLYAILFRTSVVKSANIKPSGLKFGEDLLMSMRIFPHINCLYAVNKVVYNYNVGVPTFSEKYFENWLESARLLYNIKMATISEMHYDKAIFYQNAELANYLKYYIYVCCTRRPNQREDNIEALNKEIQNPVYKKLSMLQNSKYTDKESIEYIINGDAASFYTHVENNMKSIWKKPHLYVLRIITSVKKFLSFMQKL